MITAIYAHLIDLDTGHSPDFRFERRGGLTDHLVMGFRTPARVLTADGMATAQSGDCIVHSSGFHLLHYSVAGAAEGFRNDWLYVRPEVLRPRVEALELPWDTLIRTGEPDILAPYLKRLKEELATDDEFSERAVVNQLDDLLLTLARHYRRLCRFNHEMTTAERRYYAEFTALRQHLLEHCRDAMTLKRLAERVNLSHERFAVLYKQFFRATPYAELIEARLVLARRLLLASDMEIKEIARHCGWDDLHYFSRLFRRKTGMAPTQFRRLAMSGGDGSGRADPAGP